MKRTALYGLSGIVTVLIVWCAAPVCAEEPPGLELDPRPGAFTLGMFSGEQEFYVQGDILFPLYRYDSGLIFVNPRGSGSDRSEEEFNIGLGLRHIVNTRYPFMLGANIYYDARWSRHNNRFDQIGAGVEFLSDWVDARANYYWPDKDKILIDTVEIESTTRRRRTEESRHVLGWQDPYAEGHAVLQDYTVRTTTRHITATHTLRQTFERFEAALEGWDAELGGRLPVPEKMPIEMRVFGGYQHFDNPFGSSLKGWKGRLEVRALNGHLSLDAHIYENSDLNRGDYLIGARVHVPFDLAALAQGRNPFAGIECMRTGGLEGRLTEMVMRDPKIQTRESGYIEDVSRREESVSERNNSALRDETETIVIADGILFVHGAHGNDENPGTAELPKETIQAGIDNVFDETTLYTMDWPDDVQRRVVYVFDMADSYPSGWGVTDDVITIDAPNIALIGAGVQVPGYGGKSFGSGTQALITGMPGHNAILITENGDYAAIGGFGITTASMGSRGIYSESGRIAVFDNHIGGTGDGLVVDASGDVETYIWNNVFGGSTEFETIYRSGVLVQASGDMDAHFFLDLYGNAFLGHRNDPTGSDTYYTVDISAMDYNSAFVIIEENDIADSDYGLQMWLHGITDSDGDFVVDIFDNRIRDIEYGAGMVVNVISRQGDADVWASGNVVERTNGEEVWMWGMAHTKAGMLINAEAWAGGNAVIVAERNVLRDNAVSGLALTAWSHEGGAFMDIQGNRAAGHDAELEGEYELDGTGIFVGLRAEDHAGLHFERNVMRDNSAGLAMMVHSDTGEYHLNLGNADHGTAGFNTFDNDVYNIMYGPVNGLPLLSAHNNWWGALPVDDAKIYPSVDYSHALDADPNP